MKVILFGATGMIGQGVLRECLLDPAVERVLTIGRAVTGQQHEKLREIAHGNLFDLSDIAGDLSGYDACLFCLGVASTGMSEEQYRHVTYDLTLSVARILLERSPSLRFLFVSGAGTDSTEHGRTMWARVKGQTENALLELPFKDSYMLRPGFIQPKHGIQSRTTLYRVVYAIMTPFYPVLRALFSKSVTDTEQLGRAMLDVAKRGAPKRVLEATDLVAIGQGI
ncbi:epimerase [Pendulispora rubella]|uniref:Epimerase n=1 Tax=Pendulispora rubella TaxID=2741070 RepID=A0ABZ2L8A7_9BACT